MILKENSLDLLNPRRVRVRAFSPIQLHDDCGHESPLALKRDLDDCVPVSTLWLAKVTSGRV
jgi:hypothetical protein